MPLAFSLGHSEFGNYSATGFAPGCCTCLPNPDRQTGHWPLECISAIGKPLESGSKNERASTLQTRASHLRKLAYLFFVIWWSCTILVLPCHALFASCKRLSWWLALFLSCHRLLCGPAVPPSSYGHLHPCERGAGPSALWLRCKGLAHLASCCHLAPISRLCTLASAWEHRGLHRWGHHWGRTRLHPGFPCWRVTIPSSKSGHCFFLPNRSLEILGAWGCACCLSFSLCNSFVLFVPLAKLIHSFLYFCYCQYVEFSSKPALLCAASGSCLSKYTQASPPLVSPSASPLMSVKLKQVWE